MSCSGITIYRENIKWIWYIVSAVNHYITNHHKLSGLKQQLFSLLRIMWVSNLAWLSWQGPSHPVLLRYNWHTAFLLCQTPELQIKTIELCGIISHYHSNNKQNLRVFHHTKITSKMNHRPKCKRFNKYKRKRQKNTYWEKYLKNTYLIKDISEYIKSPKSSIIRKQIKNEKKIWTDPKKKKKEREGEKAIGFVVTRDGGWREGNWSKAIKRHCKLQVIR